MNKTNKRLKEKVFIYAVYNENNMDFCIEKDNSLNLYCKDKQYNVINIVRAALPYKCIETAENFINIVKSINYGDIEKVIIYDIREIAKSNSELLVLLTILKDKRIALESIIQGRLNFNPLDPEDILSDDSTFENYKCSKNEKYFVEEEDLPF